MNIALIGYGRMGKEIEHIAKQRGHTISAIIDPNEGGATHKEISDGGLQNVDACIEFTHPSVVLENIEKLSKLKLNIVVGTTGWYDTIVTVKSMIEKNGNGFIYGSNFSVGVNVFFAIVEKAAKIMNNVQEYDVFGYELHHNQKADSPSGTARSVAEILEKNIDRKTKINYEMVNRKINPEELHYASIRAGSIPGTHVAGFDSAADTIELRHTARNRKGFALGAVLAAEFIQNRKGFYTLKDLMKTITGG